MKDTVFNTLTTPYAEGMDKASPWNIYPRPQFKRDSFFSLNGEWDFSVSEKDEIPCTFNEKILVPFPPESLLSGIERKMPENGYMVYKKSFSLPEDFIKDRIILHFGAVDQCCIAFLNQKCIGKNEGGYLPFSFDITDYIVSGDNELILIVRDPLDKKYPYGKQTKKRGGMWYTPVSGIWQTVWIESLPKNPIFSIRIDQTSKNAKITVNSKAEYKKLTLKESGAVYEFTEDEIIITPDNPKCWTPETPYLYEFTLETKTDKIESYFALRELGTADINGKKRLTLNGKPYFFTGLLDQGYFPDGIFLPATPEGYERDILDAKKMGFNMLRKHIKIEPMIFYYLCDKLGMIVFQDMVNNSGYSFILDTVLPTIGMKRDRGTLRHRNSESRAIFLSHMERTADLLYNTPSVCYYTVFNEGWGQFCADETYKKLKSIDPTRILDATSGWFKASESDVDSRHIYFKTPNLKNPDGRPAVLSEFGGFSYRAEGHLFGKKNYGYSVYENAKEFEDAVFELYTSGTLPLIKEGLSATVYTQLSDVEDETNGLITYDRRLMKVNAERIKTANLAMLKEFDKHTS